MDAPSPRITSGKLQEDDLALDTTLRPRRLEEFIGQEKIKDNLSISIAAAQQRGEPLDHLLLYGPPGLGKTTLAHIIAHEMSVSIRVTSGPAIERAGDLAAILTEGGTRRSSPTVDVGARIEGTRSFSDFAFDVAPGDLCIHPSVGP